jgi:hypothetical protein
LSFEVESEMGVGRSRADPYTSTICLLNNLRRLVRKTDVVFLLSHTLHFLLLTANIQGGEIVQTRLWDALLWSVHNTAEGEILHPSSMTTGHSAYPVPCQDIDAFIETASEVRLRATFGAEKAVRKTVVRQVPTPPRPQMPQQNAGDDDFPALARKLGIPYLSLLPRKPPARVQELVNPRLAQELRCYPVGRERNILTVAMLNPQDHATLQRLQQETGLNIFPVLTHPQELQTVLEQLI